MTVYYNEYDKKTAAWLRELISVGVIAPGIVDERSILDVRPGDLRGFTQCHFFAGIGVWSYALRRAGWPDRRRVWTGSCPCQPFSAAGKGAGFDDERHLWPAWYQLIAQCRPVDVFGEQVASKDGLAWLDLVQPDLEAAGYAVWPADLCAAGVGAPHIRQRLFFVGTLDDAGTAADGRLADSSSTRLEIGVGDGRVQRGALGARQRQTVVGGGYAVGVADDDDRLATGAGGELHDEEHHAEPRSGPRRFNADDGRGTPWSDADWIYCRDDKFRPVEPGTFPLAHGSAARVGRLRGYGNAIVAEAAQAFIEATGLIL